tara:strand:+ start:3916 stop:4218 length:303 start_codon:yes stop_codon:yes gene_type:complete
MTGLKIKVWVLRDTFERPDGEVCTLTVTSLSAARAVEILNAIVKADEAPRSSSNESHAKSTSTSLSLEWLPYEEAHRKHTPADLWDYLTEFPERVKETDL